LIPLEVIEPDKKKRTHFVDQLCPYDGARVELVPSTKIYGAGRDYGWMYACVNWPKCDSYVGCHRGTKRPLGRLSNKELREAKNAAHAVFDALWKRKVDREGCSAKTARTSGYAWLADVLQIEPKKCHIGMFDLETCRRVVAVCRPYLVRK